ncbi:MAG: hypothetical protein JWM05_1564 [Acidimicrobiales bacterium]|nr:hypothetical protein [Acidimicrobiales bacterium]
MDDASVGSVAQLWRYPVKSMQGAPVDRVEVDERGVVGDRGWGVVDLAAGKVLSAKRWGQLLEARADRDVDTVTVTLPDGSTHEAGAPDTDAALSAWLGREVRLVPPPAGDGLPYELPTEAWDDASETWEFPGPPGGPFVDLAAAHLLTTASLAAAAALHPDGEWDVRRFRPTALLDVAGDTFVEDAWLGLPVRLGAVVVEPFMPTVRCAMITRQQPGLPRDVEIARVLNREHELNLGLYCSIGTPGVIAVGDPVSVLPAPAPA